MKGKVFVEVDFSCDNDGNVIPLRIHWNDGRVWNIERVVHACESCINEYDGVRYTVLLSGACRYLYRFGKRWYVEQAS